MKTKKQSIKWKWAYLFSAFPIVSIGMYLLLMMFGQTEDFALGGILAFVIVTVIWGFAGSSFARAKMTIGKAILFANIVPLLSTFVYTILYVVARFSESEAILSIAEVIGGLGTGVLGVIGTMLYALIPVASQLSLFEVYINIVYSLIVFVIGFAVGTPNGKRKRSVKEK